MTQMHNEKLAQILRAIAAAKAQQAKDKEAEVPAGLNRQRCERFSDYMTTRLLDICNSGGISGRFQNWPNKSNADKLKLASDIVKAFLNAVSRDIRQHEVPIYNRDGGEYRHTGDEFDTKITNKMSKMPEISVEALQDSRSNDGMCVTSTRRLRININHPAYKASPLQFLSDLRHELTHVIDIFVPAISPLDPAIRAKAMRSYVGPHENKEAYQNNPLEWNANLKRADYKQRLDAMLTMQETNLNRAMNMKMLGMNGRVYQR